MAVFLYLYRNNPFKFSHQLRILPFTLSISTFVITGFFDFMEFYLPLGEEGEINDKIYISSAVTSLLFVAMVLNNVGFGKRTQKFAKAGEFLGIVILTITLVDIIAETQLFITIKLVEENWRIFYDSKFLFLLFIEVLLNISAMHAAHRFQTIIDEEFIHKYMASVNKKTILLFSTGALILMVNLLFKIYLIPNVGGIVSILSTLMILFGLLIQISLIINNPYSTLFLRGDASVLINLKRIGWLLFSNTDDGPEYLNGKKDVLDQYKIEEYELIKFGIQSITSAYSEGKFATNVSLTPFAGSDLLLALTIHFIHKNRNLQDPRLNNNAFSSFSIIMPTFLMESFSKPIGYMIRLVQIVERYISETPSIQSMAENEHLESLATELLEAIF